MVGEIAADLVALVGHRDRAAGRIQEELRVLDGVRGQHVDLAGHDAGRAADVAVLVALPSLVGDAGDGEVLLVGVDEDLIGDRLPSELDVAGLLGHDHVLGGVVLCLDRTAGNAAAAAVTLRAAVRSRERSSSPAARAANVIG